MILRASGLDARDRAFVTFIVYGAVREQPPLDALLIPRCHQTVDRLEPRVRAALRIGTFQLLHDIAPHAAVNDDRERGAQRARGLVNAVLRSVAAAGPPYPESDDARGALLVPELDRRRARGAGPARRAASRCSQAATSPRRSRCDRIRVAPPPTRSSEELEAAGDARVDRGQLVPDALVVSGIGDPVDLPPSPRAGPRPRTRAARPSSPCSIRSRATVCSTSPPRPAARPPRRASGSATDSWSARRPPSRPARARAPGRRAPRSRRRRHAVVADGRRLPVSPGRVRPGPRRRSVHRARRAPSPSRSRWRIDPGRGRAARELQRTLLQDAATAVRPGGLLVYSVCTLTRAETTACRVGPPPTSTGSPSRRCPARRGAERCGRLAASAPRGHRRHVRPSIAAERLTG